MTSMPGGIALAQSVGIPMPRLTKSPSFISSTARRIIPSRGRAIAFLLLGLAHRPALDPLLAGGHDDALDEDAGRVDALRVEGAGFDEPLEFRAGDPAGGHGHRVEVAGRLPVHEVSHAVRLPRRDEREVAHDAPLEKVIAAVEVARLLPPGDQRPGSRGRVEGG